MATIPESRGRAVPAWRARLERFWRWWSGQLRGLAPALGATRVPLVAFEGDRIVVVEPKALEGGSEGSVDVAGLDPARAHAAVRGLLVRAGEGRPRARLALDGRHALVRRVAMPAATEENLGSVLGFEMDRLTPFRAEEVYYDYRVVGRDGGTGTIAVLLAVARRDEVDALVARARELGLSVQGVAIAGHEGLDVLPTGQRGERERPRERLVKQVLAGATVVLLLAALAIPALRKRAEVHAIKPMLDKSLGEAQATDKLIKELERQVADYNFVLAKKHERGPVLDYVEEVARLLPDHTWLQQFDVKTTGKAREIQISGETLSSSKLIEVLEQSQLLQNATPRGTVTRGTMPGTERFVIAAEGRPRKLPESRAVTEVQPAPSPTAFAPRTHAAPPTADPGTAAARTSAPPTAVVTPIGRPAAPAVGAKPGDPGIIWNPVPAPQKAPPK